jgi:predicted ATP-dependent endonuclease of OLD family
MRITKLKLDGFKGYEGLSAEFSESNPYQIFIGNNGSGKSNLLEAISLIYKNMDIGEKLDFYYSIEFKDERDIINITNNYDKEEGTSKREVIINGTKGKINNIRTYIPEYVFAMYSGDTKRLKKIFEVYESKSKRLLLDDQEIRLQKQLYLLPDMYKFLMISAFAIDNTSISDFIKEYFSDMKFEGIRLKLKKPSWGEESYGKYWGAAAGISDFLDRLIDSSFAPRIGDDGVVEEIYIPDLISLKASKFMMQTSLDYFASFLALEKSELIDEFELMLKKTDGCILNFEELSEGEKQLLAIRCLIEITKSSEALYLFDEPDVFLHPRWQREFVEIIDKIDHKSQMFCTTHSPFTLGVSDKENINIISNREIFKPSSDTYNREINDIITEVMDTSIRPVEVQTMINDFYFEISQKDILKAERKFDTIVEILSKGDSFIQEGKSLLTRLRLLG